LDFFSMSFYWDVILPMDFNSTMFQDGYCTTKQWCIMYQLSDFMIWYVGWRSMFQKYVLSIDSCVSGYIELQLDRRMIIQLQKLDPSDYQIHIIDLDLIIYIYIYIYT
jgi:hypothetical protein